MVARAARCFSGVTPAQQAASYLPRGKADTRSRYRVPLRFISGPRRGNQQFFRPIPRQSVDHHFLRQDVQAVLYERAVFLYRRDGKGFLFIFPSQLRAAQDLELLNLDPVGDRESCRPLNGAASFMVPGSINPFYRLSDL